MKTERKQNENISYLRMLYRSVESCANDVCQMMRSDTFHVDRLVMTDPLGD